MNIELFDEKGRPQDAITREFLQKLKPLFDQANASISGFSAEVSQEIAVALRSISEQVKGL